MHDERLRKDKHLQSHDVSSILSCSEIMVMNSLICRPCLPLEGKGVVVLLKFVAVTFSTGACCNHTTCLYKICTV